MALMTIPPWVSPPNYLGAAESGARLGLAQRQQDTSEAEAADRLAMALRQQDVSESQAADRLRLAYSSLESQERRAAQAAQARLAQSSAAMALRAQQQEMMGQFRAQAEKRQQAAADALASYRTDRLAQLGANAEPPQWIPADPETGAPGHFVTHTGQVHIPSAGAANVGTRRTLLSDMDKLKAKIDELGQPELSTDPETTTKWQDLVGKLEERRKLLDALGPVGGRKTSTPTLILSSPTASLPTTPSTVSNPYIVGRRYGDLRYKGGDPNDESSWEKAE